MGMNEGSRSFQVQKDSTPRAYPVGAKGRSGMSESAALADA